ncbi:hypothetical protein AMD27_13910 [Acinetobacter sp. TGL-Y2]|uniref:hypothetical protein n=1 Tax=Acinetobacter sp. TGL-Y2 TaxID=1407071 RepID=UPI0007A66244|nr:hypothetical protein [Acinetobacter sp. TGL-Y2]AMW79878.1 hypothetical protein AMD27_13910 [Acinetobacter sp. TGL-Y2]
MVLDHSNNSKLMWIIVAGLVIIVTLAVVFLWMSSKDHSRETASIETSEPVSGTVSSTLPNVALESASEATIALDTLTDANALVSDNLLKDEIPHNATFAKEEIVKLNDLQQQLQAQHEILEAQQSDADQLIALKEEQIKLLEEQLSVRN